MKKIRKISGSFAPAMLGALVVGCSIAAAVTGSTVPLGVGFLACLGVVLFFDVTF